MKERRAKISKEEIIKYSNDIFENCKTLLNENQNILAYINFNEEIQTEKIINSYKNVFVPKCINKTDMIAVDYKGEKVRSKFGVLEPVTNKEIKNIDVAVIPGLCFDKNGNRIGYGAGYYDRYLTKYPNILKIAVCYDFQIVDFIETQEHDVKMDYIVTNRSIIKIENNSR